MLCVHDTPHIAQREVFTATWEVKRSSAEVMAASKFVNNALARRHYVSQKFTRLPQDSTDTNASPRMQK